MKVSTEKVTIESTGTLDASAGTLFYPPQIATASLPAAASYEGIIVYDLTRNKLVFSNGTAYEVATSS